MQSLMVIFYNTNVYIYWNLKIFTEAECAYLLDFFETEYGREDYIGIEEVNDTEVILF